MNINRRRVEATILLCIAVGINTLLIAGFVTRPIIAYNIDTPLDYNQTIDLESTNLQVDLIASNKGGSPARINFLVRIYNLTVKEPLGLDISSTDQFSTIKIPIEKPLSKQEKELKTIEITNEKDREYLILIFSIEPRLTMNPFESFFSSFEVHKPERPTALLLKQIEPGIYKRVTQR